MPGAVHSATMPLSWSEIRQNAIAFSREWAGATRERGDAQSFWNEFFRCFGVSRRMVASFEAPVATIRGTYEFIDLLWPGTLIAEHTPHESTLPAVILRFAFSRTMAALMFREAILAQLDRRKWTQYRLVQESGVSKTAVYDFLAGKRDLSGGNLEQLCKTLNLALTPRRKYT